MTPADLAEIKELLAVYRAELSTQTRAHVREKRARLETVLVRHADALIDAAERQVGVPVDDIMPAPPMAEWPEEERR